MILKIVRKFKNPDVIYTSVPYLIDEEVKYYDFGNDEVVVQTVSDSVDQTLETFRNQDSKVLYAVVSGNATFYIHVNESAYLLNEAGKTLQIIYRP